MQALRNGGGGHERRERQKVLDVEEDKGMSASALIPAFTGTKV